MKEDALSSFVIRRSACRGGTFVGVLVGVEVFVVSGAVVDVKIGVFEEEGPDINVDVGGK